MISPTSRYADSTVATVEVNGASRHIIVIPGPQVEYAVTYTSYQWLGNDRLDNLAYTVYGDPQKWWVIADANPEILLWDSIQPGAIIRIPEL